MHIYTYEKAVNEVTKMIASILKTLSDINRLRILNLLNQREMCVCEIEYLTEISQSNLSRHLKNMTNLGLLISWKENKFSYFRINEAFLDNNPFIREIMGRLSEEEVIKKDEEKYQEYLTMNIPCECISDLILERRFHRRKDSQVS
ncbi:MAG: metalloregulator ArsR/SmtB family transcription factor [Eubacterium sp.]|nr:metalloregulator ArsR/SmtB family transcription factor [Eubacterium sp.]